MTEMRSVERLLGWLFTLSLVLSLYTCTYMAGFPRHNSKALRVLYVR